MSVAEAILGEYSKAVDRPNLHDYTRSREMLWLMAEEIAMLRNGRPGATFSPPPFADHPMYAMWKAELEKPAKFNTPMPGYWGPDRMTWADEVNGGHSFECVCRWDDPKDRPNPACEHCDGSGWLKRKTVSRGTAQSP